MKSNTRKVLVLGLLVPVTAAAFFMIFQLQRALDEVPDSLLPEAQAPVKAESHAEVKENSHGAPPEGGHGPSADAHGAPATGERSPTSVALVSVDEVFVNVGYGEHIQSLGLKVELELFEETSRQVFDSQSAGIKHTVIEATRAQNADRLHTISGKLYFKEYLVTRLNAFFKQPIVREVHFSSFYLQ